MQKYNLDFETLLSLLEEIRQNGVISTHVLFNAPGQKASHQLRIGLAEGKIISCQIKDSTGQTQTLDNNKVYSLLSDMGPLEWLLDPRLPDGFLPSSSTPQTIPPKHTGPLPAMPPKHTGPRTPGSTGPLPGTPGSTRPFPYTPGSTEPLPGTPQNIIPLRNVSSIVPRLLIHVEPVILQALSRNQRRVLVLVDGTRNIEKITTMLFSSSQSILEVLKILRELEALRLITLEMQ